MHATDKHESMTWDQAKAIAEQTVKQPYRARKARPGSKLFVVSNTETGWTDDRHLPPSLAIEDARKMNGRLVGDEMLRLMREHNGHRRMQHEITHRPVANGGYVLEARRDHFCAAFGPICLTVEAADAAREYVLENAERMHTGSVASGPVAWPIWHGEASWPAFRAAWHRSLI